MYVYIAGPYSRPDPEVNVARSLDYANKVLGMGHIPFVPHLYHYWDQVDPKAYEVWTELDMRWLEKCDVLLRIPGDSPGSDAEVEHAESLGIKVIYSITDL